MTIKTQLDFTLSVPIDDGEWSLPPKKVLAPSINSLLSGNDPFASTELSQKTITPVQMNEDALGFLKTFSEVILKKTQASGAPLLTSGSTSTEDEISSISYLLRTFIAESPAAEAFGVTTGENVAQGAVAFAKAVERFVQARNIQDRGGMIEGGLDAVRGYFQSIGGVSYLGYRGAMIASDLKGVNTSAQATTPLGQSSFFLGMIGNIAFLGFYAMIGFWSAYSLTEDFKFSSGMKAHKNDPKQCVPFNFLMRKVTADPKAKLEKLKRYWETLPLKKKGKQIAAFKNKLADAALSRFTGQFLVWQDELFRAGELKEKPLTESQAREVFKALLQIQLQEKNMHATYAAALGLDKQDLEDFNFSAIELIGFKLEEARSQEKKEAKFSRATNEECTEAVKKSVRKGLGERLKCNDALVRESAQKDLNELQGKVVAENTKNKKIHFALTVIAVLGVAISVMAFVHLSSVAAIALIVITVLLVGGMMATDGYAMLEGWKIGEMPGRYDKHYIIGISLVLIAALGVSIGVTLGLSLAILPLILSCGIGGIGLGLSSVAYYKLVQKERAWIENHPDLQRFKDLLDSMPIQDGDIDDKVTALFKKLSKADRIAIRNKYSEMSKRGVCGFKQPKYEQLDKDADFGGMYLLDAICRKLDEKEHQSMICAMKKSVKFFWEKWVLTKNEKDRQRALKLQSLFESMKQRLQDIGTKLDEISSDDETYTRLKNDLWYVIKRQENAADLKQVVNAVIQDSRNPVSISASTGQEQNRNKVISLVQRVFQMHKAAF